MEIEFKHVSLISPTSKKKSIDDLSLLINSNQITGVIGKSGSGKTVVLELISSLIVPSKGKIIIGGSEKKVPKNVGLVYQNSERQFSFATVREEIEFVLNKFHYSNSSIDKRIIDSLKMVGLDESYLKRSPFCLSVGEQKKVSLAIALSYNPKIVLLDEPTLGLDGEGKRHLIKLLRMMKLRYNKTIVIVCSDTDFLHQIADYIYVLEDGSIFLEGDKYKVFSTESLDIRLPKIMEFSNIVKAKKGINLGYRDDIDDLAKDIYRHARNFND